MIQASSRPTNLRSGLRRVPTVLALLLAMPAQAIITCELNGEQVNTANGSTTAGKTGLVRCRDSDTGELQREQELQNGRFIGLVRYYQKGVLLKEHRVNERGNRDGLAKEFAGKPGANPLLREETLRNGTTVGRLRTWHAEGGALRSVAMHDDKGQEQARAEFTREGRLRELRCASQPLLAPDADDARWCGHGGQPGSAEFFNDAGTLTGRATHERGELRRGEMLFANGKPRFVEERTRDGGRERRYAEDGALRAEKQWTGSGRERRTTLEREHFESGQLAVERLFRPSAQDPTRHELASEQSWYQNGQARAKQEYAQAGPAGARERSDTGWHDNGQLAYEGRWRSEGGWRDTPIGVHKRYAENGRLRSELHHDDRGRLTRERGYDDSGMLVRDDEVFEDGSRKRYAK